MRKTPVLFLTKVCGRKAKACQAVVIDGQLPTVAKATVHASCS